MDIFDIIDSAKPCNKYNKINTEGYMIPLSSREYDFIYKELRYKNTFYYIDKSDNLNFLIKIGMGKDIEKIVKNKKTLEIFPELDGVSIELKIDGFDKKHQFVFDFLDNNSLYKLKRLMDSHSIYMSFIIYDEKNCIKDFTVLFQFEDIIMEKLKYMISFSYNASYPRIKYEQQEQSECKYMTINSDINVLDYIMEIIDRLKKWSTNDVFDILINYNKELSIIIDGKCSNYNYIKNELVKKYSLVQEGTCQPMGRPFCKFKCGMLYFFDNNKESNSKA